ncbi:MAG: 4Fe-4S binding protein, partial [Planctomycetota bacterium]
LADGPVRVDRDWCIGCGICIGKCSTGAARLIPRPDREGRIPETNFRQLHEKIMVEKGLA